MGAGIWFRRMNPRPGVLGEVVHGSAGDCEYIDEPLKMERTF